MLVVKEFIGAGVLASVSAAIWVFPGPLAWWKIAHLDKTPVGSVETKNKSHDPLAWATIYDLIAVCLHAGLAVPVALESVSQTAPGSGAGELSRVARSLALGADPESAWDTIEETSPLAALARIARRSAHNGFAMAEACEELAAGQRSTAIDAATASASRAGVALAGPLGLCFLPAFVCLGIVPVIVGLGATVLGANVVPL